MSRDATRAEKEQLALLVEGALQAVREGLMSRLAAAADTDGEGVSIGEGEWSLEPVTWTPGFVAKVSGWQLTQAVMIRNYPHEPDCVDVRPVGSPMRLPGDAAKALILAEIGSWIDAAWENAETDDA